MDQKHHFQLQLTLIFGVLFSELRHFCIHMQVMLLRATLPVSLTNDYGNFLRKGSNTLSFRIDFT